ncbi:hypothetical protein OUZ56_001129 [Daphnia magna]|uniref:Uncharacterized protein n=1 Tax=Daphnia magna TaxID=35525 RepID=A0ABR0A1Q6_9CRUS|nr:hypothetical protein OUZ56_001129 [Daphnia magna]
MFKQPTKAPFCIHSQTIDYDGGLAVLRRKNCGANEKISVYNGTFQRKRKGLSWCIRRGRSHQFIAISKEAAQALYMRGPSIHSARFGPLHSSQGTAKRHNQRHTTKDIKVQIPLVSKCKAMCIFHSTHDIGPTHCGQQDIDGTWLLY